ncbi:TPA: MliC family protein [Yersinia enterocolitica]|nr:MliC family protein [Yersinia enterocolitica]
MKYLFGTTAVLGTAAVLMLTGCSLVQPKNETLHYAASGAKYSDNHYTFWSKGNTAFVERDDKVIINDCMLIK